MLDHINKQCISLTNTNTKEHLKETDLLWNPEKDIAIYFTKPHKEEERLKKIGIIWNELRKVTQAANRM